MFYSLNPILKDHKSNFNPVQYIHGTYRMKFLRRKVEGEEEDTTPVM
jgi:hypothetical protein